MVGLHSCKRACRPVLSSQDGVNMMITGHPKYKHYDGLRLDDTPSARHPYAT